MKQAALVKTSRTMAKLYFQRFINIRYHRMAILKIEFLLYVYLFQVEQLACIQERKQRHSIPLVHHSTIQKIIVRLHITTLIYHIWPFGNQVYTFTILVLMPDGSDLHSPKIVCWDTRSTEKLKVLPSGTVREICPCE